MLRRIGFILGWAFVGACALGYALTLGRRVGLVHRGAEVERSVNVASGYVFTMTWPVRVEAELPEGWAWEDEAWPAFFKLMPAWDSMGVRFPLALPMLIVGVPMLVRWRRGKRETAGLPEPPPPPALPPTPTPTTPVDDGSPLDVRFGALSAEGQRRVHVALCRQALEAWEAYARERRQIRYFDSVVGMRHVVDAGLPRRALRAVETGEDADAVHRDYAEPLAALQDDDLEFPDPIEFAWYSVYNLFERYVRGRDVDAWLIVNQALSSTADEAQWRPRLLAALAEAAGGEG